MLGVISKSFVIRNKAGLHARSASLFVENANMFTSEVYVLKGKTRANAKSILGVFALGVYKDDEITLEIDGDDESVAIEHMGNLIDSKFFLEEE